MIIQISLIDGAKREDAAALVQHLLALTMAPGAGQTPLGIIHTIQLQDRAPVYEREGQ